MTYYPQGPIGVCGYVPYGSVDIAEDLAHWATDATARSHHRTNIVWMVELTADQDAQETEAVYAGEGFPYGAGPLGDVAYQTIVSYVSTALRYASRGFVLPDTEENIEQRLVPINIGREIP